MYFRWVEDKKEQAAGGFEPPNNGFANRRLRPLGYAAGLYSSAKHEELAVNLHLIALFCNKIRCWNLFSTQD